MITKRLTRVGGGAERKGMSEATFRPRGAPERGQLLCLMQDYAFAGPVGSANSLTRE